MRTFTLPIPPSTNKLFANAGSKGRVKSDAYKAWLAEAGYKLNLQRVEQNGNRVAIEIFVPVINSRDASNFIKPIEDLMVKHKIIKNDSMKYVWYICVIVEPLQSPDEVTVRFWEIGIP